MALFASKYRIYSYQISEIEKDVIYIKQNISIFGFILGPFAFLLFKLWREFFCFIILSIVINYVINTSNISIWLGYLMNLVINLYIALDLHNRREIALLRAGYQSENNGNLVTI